MLETKGQRRSGHTQVGAVVGTGGFRSRRAEQKPAETNSPVATMCDNEIMLQRKPGARHTVGAQ